MSAEDASPAPPHLGSDRLKIDIASDLPRLSDPRWDESLQVWIHTLQDLGGNKVAGNESRAEIKDVIDLYYLATSRSWTEMFLAADHKRIPIAYESLQLLVSQPISGTAMVKSSLPFDVPDFIASLNRELADEIKKKQLHWSRRIEEVVSNLLWDAPRDKRCISEATRPVLARRSQSLPEPQRRALENVLH